MPSGLLSTQAQATETGFVGYSPDSDPYRLQGVPFLDAVYAPTQRMPRYVPPTSIVSILDSGHGWIGSSGFVSADTTDYITGTQSIKITTSSTATFRMEKTGLALDMTGMQWRLRLKCPDISNVNAINFKAASDTAYAHSHNWFINGTQGGSNHITSGGTNPHEGWVTVTLNYGDATATGSPNRAAIERIKVEIARTASPGEVTLQLDEVEVIPEPSYFANGLVSVCFDDILESVWTLAQPKLAATGIRTSQYIISDQIGLSGRVKLAQLYTMQDQGHEIAPHAYTDADHTLSFTGMSSSQLEADLRLQAGSLRSLGFKGQGTAYPLGQYGLTTDGVSTIALTRKYMAYARTTSRGNNKTGETFPPGDPYRLRATSSITTFSGGYAPATVLGTGNGSLDTTKANKGWMILVFHKIVTGAPASLSEIQQTDFNNIIDGIVSRGMTCLPVGEALAYFG